MQSLWKPAYTFKGQIAEHAAGPISGCRHSWPLTHSKASRSECVAWLQAQALLQHLKKALGPSHQDCLCRGPFAAVLCRVFACHVSCVGCVGCVGCAGCAGHATWYVVADRQLLSAPTAGRGRAEVRQVMHKVPSLRRPALRRRLLAGLAVPLAATAPGLCSRRLPGSVLRTVQATFSPALDRGRILLAAALP